MSRILAGDLDDMHIALQTTHNHDPVSEQEEEFGPAFETGGNVSADANDNNSETCVTDAEIQGVVEDLDRRLRFVDDTDEQEILSVVDIDIIPDEYDSNGSGRVLVSKPRIEEDIENAAHDEDNIM